MPWNLVAYVSAMTAVEVSSSGLGLMFSVAINLYIIVEKFEIIAFFVYVTGMLIENNRTAQYFDAV